MRNILAILLLLFAGAWFVAISFGIIPEANQARVDRISNLFEVTILPAIIFFFFGSSQGSADKADTIKEQVKKQE